MKPPKRLRFQKNIYLLFAISTLVPIIIISLFFAAYYSEKTLEYSRQQISNTLYSIGHSVETYMGEFDNIFFTPYLYGDLLNTMLLMKNGMLERNVDYLDTGKLQKNFEVTFIKIIYTSPIPIDRIAFYPKSQNEDIVYVVDRSVSGMQLMNDAAYHLEGWYADVAGTDEISFSGFYEYINHQSKPKTAFSASRAIKDFDSNKIIGYMKVDSRTEKLEEILDGVITSENSRILLLDEDGRLLYSPREVDEGMLSAINSGSINSGGYNIFDYTIAQTGWKVVYVSSASDIILSNSSAAGVVLLVSVLALAAAFAVYKAQTSKMVGSVSAIIESIKCIEKGDLVTDCVVKDKTEFSMIADALNKMRARLSDYIEKEYKAVINQRNAEYLALQSQINPHFLYNLLNGFIALNRMGERDILEKCIFQLTNMFRYTCNNANISTLLEEINFAREYLELQKLRFESRISYELFIDEAAESVKIPKLLIQPIVENSIVHGMGSDGAEIKISVHAETVCDGGRQQLEIVIRDDGVGFDSALKGVSGGVGLVNIRDRVNHFNPEARFMIESAPDRGAVCTICIPL